MPYIYDIVSDDQLATAMFVYTKFLGPTLQISAITFNVLNMVTFSFIGLKDCFNFTFLALSISDFFCVLLDTADIICLNIAMSPWQLEFPVSLHSIGADILYYQHIFLDTSICFETYLALARCCCVALPLRFKHVFTFERTVAIILVLFLCNFAFRIPLLSSYRLVWVTNPLTNQTTFAFYSTEDYRLYNWIEQVVARTAFPVVLFCIALLCSVILTSSLVNASQKRKLMSSAHESLGTNEIKFIDHMTRTSHPLNAKEVQLVKAVALVTIVLGFVLLVLSEFSLVQAAVPDFFPHKTYNNTYGVSAIVLSLLINFHAGYKIFVYYTFNARFSVIVKEKIFGISRNGKERKTQIS